MEVDPSVAHQITEKEYLEDLQTVTDRLAQLDLIEQDSLSVAVDIQVPKQIHTLIPTLVSSPQVHSIEARPVSSLILTPVSSPVSTAVHTRTPSLSATQTPSQVGATKQSVRWANKIKRAVKKAASRLKAFFKKSK